MHTFQEIVAKLNAFWAKQGCVIVAPYDTEKGASTFNPATFLRSLGPEPFRAACIEPCRRPKDGRYGTNPNRLQHYFQYQVILKPAPYNIQDLYLQSLVAIGLSLDRHDIRFVHDDWESPTLGAWGLGWEVWCDGQEVSQFTYFQQVAGIPLKPITGEITYGIERLVMYLQNVDSIFDIQWSSDLTYRDLYFRNEVEWSTYNFELLDAKMWFKHFEDFEKEAKRLVQLKLPLPAYDFVIKASHAFNMLDARGAISVSERASYIANIRDIAKSVAECYLESRKEQGFPLLKKFSHEALPSEKEPPKKTPKLEKPANFLLEIGVEEIPATFVPIGLNSLEHQMKKLLDEKGLSYSSVKVLGTPRRLAIFVENLEPLKKEEVIEKRGPAIEHAFEADGSLKQAGQGFFKSLQKPAYTLDEIKANKDSSIFIRELKGVSYLFSKQTIPEINTAEFLQQKLSDLILAIDFPKKMRWADLDISFARPIRWLIALFGEHTLHFSCGPITSSNISFGHRQLDPSPIVIDSANTYVAQLKTHHVLVDIQERKSEIEQALQKIEKDLDVKVLARERVIPQVLNLIEYPFLTVTEFNSDFLKAPQEVLISEMVEHQKYFPIASHEGVLKNLFVITANTKPTDSIRHGNRKVISARLSDGVFLYEQDLKTPLESFNEKLKGMVFQKGLGTMYDKVLRIENEVKVIAKFFDNVDQKELHEAAKLSKADLATEMVGEFPELQGEMGRIYAEKQGKKREVALAIHEQWMPRGEGAPLPEHTLGKILSLTDKIDNLIGFFALDLKPTSSSDPYALRRQGLGLIRILIQNKIHLPLKETLCACLTYFPQELQKKKDTVVDEIHQFLIGRLKTVLQELGFPKGEIEACLATGTNDVFDVFERLSALNKFRKENRSFQQLIEVHKRCQGQINGLKRFTFSEKFVVENEEKKLAHALKERFSPFALAIREKNYLQALQLLSELQPDLAALFDKVKILADDEQLKMNRLALLQDVHELFSQVADFQKIQEK